MLVVGRIEVDDVIAPSLAAFSASATMARAGAPSIMTGYSSSARPMILLSASFPCPPKPLWKALNTPRCSRA
jgi:hypothetical protein